MTHGVHLVVIVVGSTIAVRAASLGIEHLQHKLRRGHAAAEQLPLEPACLDLVVVADALHFLDAELTGQQTARLLAPRGALALVTCNFADTPFMRGVLRLIEESVPRRPRALTQSILHLSALTGVPLATEQHFHDETPVDHATLERILR